MITANLLNRLEAEGVSASLNLKIEANAKPSPKTLDLIRENRDTLLEHLARERCPIPEAQNDPTPLFNKDAGKPADNTPYRPVNETTSGGSEVVRMVDNLANYQRASNLRLYGDLLLNLMVWTAQHQELRLGHPNGVILNAKPEHISPELYPWGVVYDIDRRVLVSWGDVPARALIDKRDLETGELLIPEAVAA